MRAGHLADVLSAPATEVAPLLLGAVVSRGEVAVRLTEVEAYAGPDDPGSHAYRRTPRSEVMYGDPAVLYVYFSYGMHVCANIVTGPPGTASAVLMRAGEVVRGQEVAARRRQNGSRAVAHRDLARGPGRLGQALGIDLADNGTSLETGPVHLELAEPVADSPGPGIRCGPRVGLRQAADRPWRWWLADEPSVSVYRPADTRQRRR